MAVIVAQMVERLLPTPDIYSLSPVISKFDLLSTVFKNFIEKTKIKIKQAGMVHFLKHIKFCFRQMHKTLTCLSLKNVHMWVLREECVIVVDVVVVDDDVVVVLLCKIIMSHFVLGPSSMRYTIFFASNETWRCHSQKIGQRGRYLEQEMLPE